VLQRVAVRCSVLQCGNTANSANDSIILKRAFIEKKHREVYVIAVLK